MNTAIVVDPALIRKYDKAGPRYLRPTRSDGISGQPTD
jgi:hypothetical protein